MKSGTAVALSLILLTAGAAGAQDSWSAHTNAGEYAFARGDIDRAKSEFRAALDTAQGFPAGDRRLETSLENLAKLYENQSDFDTAQPLYQLLLAAKETRLGVDDPGLLSALFAIARVSQPMGDFPTVVDSLQRYATIAEESGEANPRKNWQVLQMLARMLTIQEQPDRALEWQRKAKETIANDPGATLEERSTILEALAEMELVAGNGGSAERIYLEVAELLEEEDEADAFPRTMARGAEIALAAGELETAERLAMRSVNAHPDAAAELKARTVLAELGWIKVNRGTDDMSSLLAAAEDGEDVIRARDRLRSLMVLGPEDEAMILTRLAQVEALRGQPASAADWQWQLLESLPADSDAASKARWNLVILLDAAGRFDEGLTENAVVLADLEARYGPSDTRLMPVLAQRLELLEGARQKKEAKQVRKRMKKLSRQ